MQKKYLALLAVLVVVVACGAGVWPALAPSAARFVVPGASDVQVRSLARGTREISYRFDHPNLDWAALLDRQLRAQGWLPPDYSGAKVQFTIYSYVNYIWIGSIWEQADVQGEAQRGHIVVQRWLRLRWLFTEPIPL